MSVAESLRLLQEQYQNLMALVPAPALPDGLTAGEARVLAAIAAREGQTASELGEQLGLDAGYLSRMLTAFQKKKWILRQPARHDARAKTLALSAAGRTVASAVMVAQMQQEDALIALLPEGSEPLLNQAVKQLTTALVPATAPIIFRQLQRGDAGWIVHRHGTLIAAEYGWDIKFEALASQIMADFIRDYDSTCERSWVVERGGTILGSLFLVREDAEVAKLRLLYVEPSARRLGLATKLLDKALRFAESKGYQRVQLFTTSNLIQARRIYDKLGFTRIAQFPTDLFGDGLMGETWEKPLS